MRVITPTNHGTTSAKRKIGTRSRVGPVTLIAPGRFTVASDSHYGRALVAYGKDRASAAATMGHMKYAERWKALHEQTILMRSGVTRITMKIDIRKGGNGIVWSNESRPQP